MSTNFETLAILQVEVFDAAVPAAKADKGPVGKKRHSAVGATVAAIGRSMTDGGCAAGPSVLGALHSTTYCARQNRAHQRKIGHRNTRSHSEEQMLFSKYFLRRQKCIV